MPRTKARKATNKRGRLSTDNCYENTIKELQRIYETTKNERMLLWKSRQQLIVDLFKSFQTRVDENTLNRTMEELRTGKSMNGTTILSSCDGSIASRSYRSRDDENSGGSSRTQRPLGPLASALAKSRRRRSQSAHATTNTSTISRNISRIDTTTSTDRTSRSKYRTPAKRLQTMSADRGVMNPVTPKIQMNTPISILRYPKVGETVISMSGSPVVVNAGLPQENANINIPIMNNILSIQPSAMTEVDPTLASRIDKATIEQLRQLQDNLALLMSTVDKAKKFK